MHAVTFTVCTASYADWVKQSAQQVEPQTIQLRHQIHQHPELGNMEFQTSKLVQSELKSYGIEVKPIMLKQAWWAY